jgi:hypothetical protein
MVHLTMLTNTVPLTDLLHTKRTILLSVHNQLLNVSMDNNNPTANPKIYSRKNKSEKLKS